MVYNKCQESRPMHRIMLDYRQLPNWVKSLLFTTPGEFRASTLYDGFCSLLVLRAQATHDFI